MEMDYDFATAWLKEIMAFFLRNQTPEAVYWAAIKPRLDRNYVLYENEKFTRQLTAY